MERAEKLNFNKDIGSWFKIVVTADDGSYNGEPFNNINYDEQLKYPSKFPVYYNLPKIKVLDFIKSIQNITGTFAIKGNENQIKFVSINILYENKTSARDWSENFLTLKGYTLNYDFNSMAQENILQYKEDENRSRAPGALIVENETLPLSQETVTLPFATTYNNLYGMAIMPQFNEVPLPEWVEFTELSPRILKIKLRVPQNDYELTFRGLNFSELLQTDAYKAYQKIILKPIVLKADFKLTELDLKNLDFTIPIYLKQFGKYYAIIDLQNTGEKATVNMLQL